MKPFIIYTFLTLFLIGCSASTGSRYEKNEEKKSETETSKETNKKIDEDFDITPYQTEIKIEAPPLTEDKLPLDVWYGYVDTSSVLERKIIGTTDGYRVQVLSTDDIEEANRVRAEIYEKTARKEVYVTFEPPFYKVKAGDFTSKSEANDFKFKLNQLGYTEAKVVQDTVNLFE
ncbi:MAG: SPOR domain-containing protein [Ignavibacteriaceae bacterium]|nr:SPOR domain-containing protein [Ignavibacteriaceae bacterium]